MFFYCPTGFDELIQGARDNLGILFEVDFQFLIPGLSLENTEQGESY